MHNIKKYITVVFLSSCMILLTGINFFVYPGGDTAITVIADNECWDEETPPSPVEEKAPETSSSPTIIEEYIDESHQMNVFWYSLLSLYKLQAAEKLQIIHYELLSPPPEQLS